jgi:carboxylate-amine ligase
MPIVTSMLTWFPHLQALSASSPFWEGSDTGYASNRALLFQQLPTAGLPFHFSQWSEYEGYVADLTRTGVIEGLADIRWDVRPSPTLGTVEVRVCDGVPTMAELAALTALTQCLVVDLDRRPRRRRAAPDDAAVARAGEQVARRPLRPGRRDHPRRRRARAAGDRRPRRPARAAVPGRPPPGVRGRAASVADIPRRGASYQRQRAVAAAAGGDLRAVVKELVTELREGTSR